MIWDHQRNDARKPKNGKRSYGLSMAKFKPWMMSELAPKTVESYESHWNNHIKNEFGECLLGDIKPRAIQD